MQIWCWYIHLLFDVHNGRNVLLHIAQRYSMYTTTCTETLGEVCTRRRVQRHWAKCVHDDVYRDTGRSVYTTTCTE